MVFFVGPCIFLGAIYHRCWMVSAGRVHPDSFWSSSNLIIVLSLLTLVEIDLFSSAHLPTIDPECVL